MRISRKEKPWEAKKQLEKIGRTRLRQIGLRLTQIEHQAQDRTVEENCG